MHSAMQFAVIDAVTCEVIGFVEGDDFTSILTDLSNQELIEGSLQSYSLKHAMDGELYVYKESERVLILTDESNIEDEEDEDEANDEFEED